MSHEKWVYLKDGKLFMHVENAGHRYLRHGPEATDWETTLEDAHLRAYPPLVADAKVLLAHREAGILNHAPLVRR
jgi:hypothetical protein